MDDPPKRHAIEIRLSYLPPGTHPKHMSRLEPKCPVRTGICLAPRLPQAAGITIHASMSRPASSAALRSGPEERGL